MSFLFRRRRAPLPHFLKCQIEEYLRANAPKPLVPKGLALSMSAPISVQEPDEALRCVEDDYEVCSMPACRPSMAASAKAPIMSLEDYLLDEDIGFSETLLRLIDRTGKKDSAIYSRANVSRQHFSKIRNNPGYRPTKATALAFAVALELDLDEARDLIGRAGYALTKSSKFDLIVMYFLERRIYDLRLINEALYEFDQCLLGC